MKKTFLQKISDDGEKARREVIYGVYDNRRDTLFTKISDFLVDHSSISIKEKSYFFHMLAVMVDAGIPIVTALKSYAEKTPNERFSRVLTTISYNNEHGMSLSDAMSRFPGVFSDVEIGVVKSGESVGKLGPMLFKLSEQVGEQHELRMKLFGAAFYPVVVLITLSLVGVGMLVWIFPTLLKLLSDSGVAFSDLPLSTRILLHLQTGIVDYYWLIIGFIAAVYGVFKVYTGTIQGRTWWDYIKLKIPIVGTLLRRVYVLQFITLIGVLIESGLPVIQALEIIGGAIPNEIFKLKVRDVVDTVRAGGKISDSLASSRFLFPPEVVEMLRVGEKSAALGKISEKVAVQYQMEISHTLRKLTSVFEPAMILFVGLFVAILALSIMAPIFSLSNVIK